jgi:hypothetical protein
MMHGIEFHVYFLCAFLETVRLVFEVATEFVKTPSKPLTASGLGV